MRISQPVLASGLRLLAVAIVAFASLRLSLAVALVTFLIRQRQESVDALPMVFLWLGVIILGIVVYARATRLSGRAWAFITHRRGAI